MFSDRLVVYPLSFCLLRTTCPVLGSGKRIFRPPKTPRNALENIQPPIPCSKGLFTAKMWLNLELDLWPISNT